MGAIVWVVTNHVTASAIESKIVADRSVVRGFVQGLLDSGVGIGADQPISEQVETALTRLVAANEIKQIKVFAPDGTILYSTDPELRGRKETLGDDLTSALQGIPAADIEEAEESDEVGAEALGHGAVLEEYLPVQIDGRTQAVFEVYRDATPILERVAATQRDVLFLALGASVVLAILLFLMFRAAQDRLDRQTDELLETTRRDALTGLLNHGRVVDALVEQLELAHDRPESDAVAVALVDIDNFRLLNDTHGHAAGDLALREVSSLLQAELSQASIVGRFGPDEFLVVGPPACANDIEPAIHRLRGRLSELSLQFGSSERLPVTVSAGICSAPLHGDAATDLLSVASIALGEAKSSGGDEVKVADSPAEELRAVERNTFDILQGLVIAVDTKDRYTKRHSEDVARYGLFLADRIGLEPELRRTLYLAGMLHDVGKIGIPDGILRKPAALTDEEYEIVKQHVALGDHIVRDLPDIDIIRGGVRHHHERWDGRGYLDGLRGEEIPLVARILSVADAFSAMTTTRPYRKALSTQEALRRLLDAADSQLDPSLVTSFVAGMETAADAPLPGRPLPRPLTLATVRQVA